MEWTIARMIALLMRERGDQVERCLRLVVEADQVGPGETILDAYFAEVLQEGRHLSPKQLHVVVQILTQDPYVSFLVAEANRAESEKFNREWAEYKNQYGSWEREQELLAYENEMELERAMERRFA